MALNDMTLFVILLFCVPRIDFVQMYISCSSKLNDSLG